MTEMLQDDFAIFGSAPMWLAGLRELSHDLDLVARGKAWDQAMQLVDPIVPSSGVGEVVRLFDKEIEIFNAWSPGDWDIDELIDTAEVVDGIRFVSLENVMKWKQLFGREKDLVDVQIIHEYLAN